MADKMKTLNEEALEKVTGGTEETFAYTIDDLPAGDDPNDWVMGAIQCVLCEEWWGVSRRKQIEPIVLNHTCCGGHFRFIAK